MKKSLQWVIAATLVCGASVITSCKSDSDDNTAQEQAKGDRKEFIQHTRQNLKTLAENLNFSTWNSVNYLNLYINEYLLLNDNFDKGLSKAIGQELQKSLKPLPAEVVAQTGKKYEAMLNLADFDYIFKTTATGFDVTPNTEDGFVMEIKDAYYPQLGVMIGLKGSGEEYIQPSRALSNDSVAVLVKFPAHYEFTFSTKQNGAWVPSMNASFDLSIVHGDYGMELPSDATSMLLDAWNLSGTVSTVIPGDATTLEFNIGQDPTTDQAGMTFNYTHNGVKTVGLRAVLTNANGITEISQQDFNSASSILSVLTAVMAGKSIDDLTLTLLDDLTTTVKVADCQKVMQLQTAMAAARRNYADQQTIDGYTQQLNELISATMTCKGLNQQIPMKLATTKLGVDWWTVPALKFADENGYVPLTEILDKESIEYGINIIDHAAEPMQQSIIVVRQLAQALQKMHSALLRTEPAK
jgi:hypothetical protein